MTDKIAKKMAEDSESQDQQDARTASDMTSGQSAVSPGAATRGTGRAAADVGGAGTAAGAGQGLDIGKALDKGYEKKSLSEILAAPVSALQGLSDGDAQKLKEALNIKTVKDLATNKYFLRARGLFLLSGSES